METTTKTTYDWDFIMTDSDYNISLKLLEVYNNDDYEELGKALQAFHEGSKRNARFELLTELKLLMEAIILWKSSEKYRTPEIRKRIYKHRNEIEDIIEDNDFITPDIIKSLWDRAFKVGKELAEIQDTEASKIDELLNNDVFENTY